MGPLFSLIAALILAAVGAAIVIGGAFVVLRLRYANAQAFAFAIVFTVGALPSALLALLALRPIMQIAPPHDPLIAVSLSIAWLIFAPLAGGVTTTRYAIRRLATLG